jgi:hypothetical protein
MLLWRAASSLFYTVVAELCSRHALSAVESTQPDQQQLDAFHQQIQQLTQVQNAQAETLSQRLQEAEKSLQRAMIERLQLLQLELQTNLTERFQLERVELEEVLTEKFQVEVRQHAERKNKRKIEASETLVQPASKKPLQLSLRRRDVSHTHYSGT